MNIVVLAGGLSPERDVSLTSGSLIANALIKRGHRVLLLDVYFGLPGEIEDCGALFRTGGEYAHRVEEQLPDIQALRKKGGSLIGENVEKLCRYADVVFNAMHGDMGEDGTLQSYLTCFGVRFTGTNALGAAISMDKALSKTLFRAAGIPTPPSVTLETDADNTETVCKKIADAVGFPAVIKPNGCGSSVGVSIVQTEDEAARALDACRQYGASVLVEKFIKGRELTVGILGGQVLPPVEIIPHEGFYDYKNKYQGGLTTELCPAPLTPEENEYLADLTRTGFAALHLSGYARFDYILDADGIAWCLEANALPGMTPTSLLPQMAAAVGISYGELCEKILALAQNNR